MVSDVQVHTNEDGDKYYHLPSEMKSFYDGSQYIKGILHREDGPAVIRANGSKRWYINGKLHREDGPAVIRANGSKRWYINDLLHREDGPAIIRADGTKYWYLNGLLHREDGPAVIKADGTKYWYIDDKQYSEEEFLKYLESNAKDESMVKETKLHVNKDGSEFHYLPSETETFSDRFKDIKGILHRENGPAVESVYGYKAWWVNGLRHREDGPAIEWANGSKKWWVKGILHREDGPAVEYADGSKKWWVKGILHREDGPAVIKADGTKYWYIDDKQYSEEEFLKYLESNAKDESMVKETKLHVNKDGSKFHYLPSETEIFWDGFQDIEGILHREDGPAIEWAHGTKYWYLNGLLHREDGPAIIRADGYKEWYLNGLLHREDGPAVEWANGTKIWYLNGKRHREDGPAREWAGGSKDWYIHGKKHSEEEFLKYLESNAKDESMVKETKLHVNKDGSEFHYLPSETEIFWDGFQDIEGILHREDGPAIIRADGTKEWFLNGLLHREDGPAVEWADGSKEWYLNGLLHREDGPAVEWADGTKYWYLNGLLHREDGPAVIKADGYKEWYLNGKRHREDGPAVEWADGSKEWYLNGLLHREDGPAREWAGGSKDWFINGKLHREDGPAREWAGGSKDWYIHGKKHSEEEFLKYFESNAKDESMVKETKLHVNKDGSKFHYLPSETEIFWDGFQDIEGILHREDGPAIEYTSGTKYWYLNGLLHREDGPAIIRADGYKEWYLNGKRHREDGPAVEWANGTKIWYLNGKRHREDGPAVEEANGTKIWYLNGKRHREDGPAREWAGGSKDWYIHGKKHSEEEFLKYFENEVEMSDKNKIKVFKNQFGTLLFYVEDPTRTFETSNGTIKGYLHREDGPAVEWVDGRKEWFINGKRHREDGPAVEWASGSKDWYIHGKKHSEEEFLKYFENNNEVEMSDKNKIKVFEDQFGTLLYYVEDPTRTFETSNGTIKGYLHREDGPAVVRFDGNEFWYKNGVVHRDNDQPAEITDSYKAWYQNGVMHREGDMPARVWRWGDKSWWKNGIRHRDGGRPAVENANNTKEWWLNGERHRADGPSRLNRDGSPKSYHIMGKAYSEEEFNNLTKVETDMRTYETNVATNHMSDEKLLDSFFQGMEKFQVNYRVPMMGAVVGAEEKAKTFDTFSMIKKAVLEAGKMKLCQEINQRCIMMLKVAATMMGVNIPKFLETDAGKFLLNGGAPLLVHFIIEKQPQLFTSFVSEKDLAHIQNACESAFKAEVFTEFSRLVDSILDNGIQQHVEQLVSLGKSVIEFTSEDGNVDFSKVMDANKELHKAASANKVTT